MSHCETRLSSRSSIQSSSSSSTGILSSKLHVKQPQTSWNWELSRFQVQRGALTCILLSLFLLQRLVVDAVSVLFPSDTLGKAYDVRSILTRSLVELPLQAITLPIFIYCCYQLHGNAQITHSKQIRITRIYMMAVIVQCTVITLGGLYPMSPTCSMRIKALKNRVEAAQNIEQVKDYYIKSVEHMNCTMQGPTAVMVDMFKILMSSWILPDMSWMNLNYVFICVFFIFSQIESHYRQNHDRISYADHTVYMSCLLLAVCAVVARNRKYYLEKSLRSKIRYRCEHERAVEKIFAVLSMTVPVHVIEGMVLHPGECLAEEFQRASIVFIKILDFDQHARLKSPAELMSFLNKNFNHWDSICDDWKVTKIETVCEEYVCAVGVDPLEAQHDSLDPLERIIWVTACILQLQTH